MTMLRGLNYWRKLIAIGLIAVQGSFVLIDVMSPEACAADYGDTFTIKIGIKDTWLPAATTDLTAVPVSDEGTALLSWTAPDENNYIFAEKSPVAAYTVKIATFSADSVGSAATWWDTAHDVAGEPAPPLFPGNLEFMPFDSLTPGDTYYFALKSIDDADNSSPIDTKAGTPGQQAYALIPDSVPPAPANLIAVPGTGRITLAWDAVGAADLWSYRIHVDSTTPYDFADQFLISAASTSATFVHTGLTAGATYSYFITAVDKGAPDYAGYALESPASNVVSTVTNQTIPVPTGLTAYGVFASSLAVSWNASAGATLYTLEVSTSGDFTDALTIPTMNTFAILEELSADTTYYLHVNASDADGSTAFSSPVSTPTLANAPVPKAFDEITASGFRADWQPNGNPAWTDYRVEISSAVNFAFLTQAADVSGSSTAFASLAPDTTYYARARAVNAAQIATLWVNLGGVVTADGVLAISADKLANVWYSVLPTSLNAQGAAHYHYKLASNASDLPSTADPSFTGAPLNLNLSEGIWYFNIRGEDVTHTLVGVDSYGPLDIDATPPALTELRAQRSAADPTPILPDVPSEAATPRFVWDVPASLAPILGYSYTVSSSPATEPGETVNTAPNFLDYIVPSTGTYYVKVKALDGAGNWSPWTSFSYIFQELPPQTSAIPDLPSQTSVIPENNYFNPRSAQQMTIHYDIHQPGLVKMRLFTLRGELVKTLVDEQKQPGRYTIPWRGLNSSGEIVATGVYLLLVEAPGYTRTFKCIVAK